MKEIYQTETKILSYENCCVVCGSCVLQKNSKLTEMNVSPKEFTHNPRTNPECAVRVLRHSRLGKLHRRIYNKLNCILIKCYKLKRFTCASNLFMYLANGTTTLLNHQLYCLLLWDKCFNTPTSLPLTPPPPPHLVS